MITPLQNVPGRRNAGKMWGALYIYIYTHYLTPPGRPLVEGPPPPGSATQRSCENDYHIHHISPGQPPSPDTPPYPYLLITDIDSRKSDYWTSDDYMITP